MFLFAFICVHLWTKNFEFLVLGEAQPLEIDARARWSMQDLKAI